MSDAAISAKAIEYLVHLGVQLIILIIGICTFNVAESAREKVEKLFGHDNTPMWCELAEIAYIACAVPFLISVVLLGAGTDPHFMLIIRIMSGLAMLFCTTAIWLHSKTLQLTCTSAS